MTMVSGEMDTRPVLADFAGELPDIPEHLLPPNVSPSALNIDYRNGSLRKRAGVVRKGSTGYYKGSLTCVTGALGTSDGNITLSETLQTYTFLLTGVWQFVANDARIFVHSTTGVTNAGTGLWLVESGGSYYLEARCEHSGGTLAVTFGSALTSGAQRVVTVSFNTSTKTLTLTVNGSSVSDTLGANTYTQPAGRIQLGPYSANDGDKRFTFQEFRVWDGTVAATLSSTAPRKLSAAEMTAALVLYWRFLTEVTAGVGDLTDSSGNGHECQVTGGGVWPGWGSVPASDTFSDIDAVVYLDANFYVATRYHVPTTYALQVDRTTAQDRAFRTQLLVYRGKVVILNGVNPNWMQGAGVALGQLSLAAPTLSSGLTISSAGSGGSVDSGVHTYLFSVVNSTTGVESAVGTAVSSGTSVGSDVLTIDFTSGGWDPGLDQRGLDTIRIYRTKAGAAVYYFLADIDANSTSYADDAADSTLTELMPTYVGHAAPSRFGFELNDSLWLGNQDGNESRLVWTEPFTLGAFYSDNYRDLGADDGDQLTGGIAVGDRGVVFKRRSTWLVGGAGSQVSVYKFAPGVGCVQHATIAAGPDRIYFLAEGGIYVMPLPLGSGAPVPLFATGWDSFFTAMTDSDYENCAGVWDATTKRYLLTVTVAGVRKVLVYHAPRNAMALWDMEATAFCLASVDGGAATLYGGWRNWLAMVESGLNDAYYEDDAYSQDMFGTVTSATSTTLSDSGATWQNYYLINVDVTVMDADGGNVQTRTIVDQTGGTSVTVDSAWDTTPSAGWTYRFGAITANWRSQRLGLPRWDMRGGLQRVRVLHVPLDAGAGGDTTLSVSTDDRTAETFTLDPSARREEVRVAGGLGYERTLTLSQVSSDESFDVGALGLVYVPAEGVRGDG